MTELGVLIQWASVVNISVSYPQAISKLSIIQNEIQIFLLRNRKQCALIAQVYL